MTKRSRRGEFHPTIFKLMATEDKLTAASGLSTIMEVFDQSPLANGFRDALPPRSTSNNRSGGSYRLGLIQLNSFIYGHDSLDDLEEFRNDPLLEAAMKGEVVAPRTMGDFLRDFEAQHLEKMNHYLSRMARAIREFLIEVLPEQYRPNEALTIDIDSTDHIQHGEKIEGCAYNYKGNWGLYSEVAYDELGFCHGIQLAAGNTKPGSTCLPLIDHCFSGTKFEQKKYFRADSAYCYEDVIRKLMSLGVSYTIAAHDGTTSWRSHIEEITDWVPWVYSAEAMEKAEKRGRTLPKIEIGRFLWQPSWAENIRIPVVVKRTWKEPEQLGMLALPGQWDHYAIITNWNLFHHPLQEVMEFYLKRGNAENFIREEKYGFDLKQFPCLQLTANYAFAQLAMVAHNILRWVAITQKPDKPHFSKKIRRRYIYIPGKIIMHARQLILKIPVRFYEEVQRLRSGLRFNPGSSAFASGFA
ncbi:MAG: IS1380 family transposase [Oligoflexia bacterium]|nr:IS1380 family transposase [Oligoflexia bacterium]